MCGRMWVVPRMFVFRPRSCGRRTFFMPKPGHPAPFPLLFKFLDRPKGRHHNDRSYEARRDRRAHRPPVPLAEHAVRRTRQHGRRHGHDHPGPGRRHGRRGPGRPAARPAGRAHPPRCRSRSSWPTAACIRRTPRSRSRPASWSAARRSWSWPGRARSRAVSRSSTWPATSRPEGATVLRGGALEAPLLPLLLPGAQGRGPGAFARGPSGHRPAGRPPRSPTQKHRALPGQVRLLPGRRAQHAEL